VTDGQKFDVSTRRTGAETTVTLIGELDIASLARFHDEAVKELEPGVETVVLDLAGLTFCDSSGLGSLLKVKHEVEAAGARFQLRQPQVEFVKVLHVAGLTDLFDVVS
jgi:anti-sigma B factor antagonist